jgi:hypothetical protein
MSPRHITVRNIVKRVGLRPSELGMAEATVFRLPAKSCDLRISLHVQEFTPIIATCSRRRTASVHLPSATQQEASALLPAVTTGHVHR